MLALTYLDSNSVSSCYTGLIYSYSGSFSAALNTNLTQQNCSIGVSDACLVNLLNLVYLSYSISLILHLRKCMEQILILFSMAVLVSILMSIYFI